MTSEKSVPCCDAIQKQSVVVDREFGVGDTVSYWSDSRNRWVKTQVVSKNAENGRVNLECKQGALADKIRGERPIKGPHVELLPEPIELVNQRALRSVAEDLALMSQSLFAAAEALPDGKEGAFETLRRLAAEAPKWCGVANQLTDGTATTDVPR